MIENALEALTPLDRNALQNLIQYAASRTRSIGLAYVTNHARFTEVQKQAYIIHFSNELLIGSYIVGYAVALHGTVISIPSTLRRLMKFITQSRLSNISSLLHTVTEHNPTEHLLAYYSGDWWTDYPSSVTVSDSSRPVTTVTALIENWKVQKRNAIALDSRHIVDAANFSGLTLDELREARSVAIDTLSILELEADMNMRQLDLVNTRIIEMNDLDKKLSALAGRSPAEIPEIWLQGSKGEDQTGHT
ncbi:hypothetical protein EST38_g10588 [Candolleomyces aberdarensis]|uniref:Uncharacterized protein n=1 Tax=Candolleomyces aberdarensis TaxID=2316362 RepID=A0A4Q2D708_9AGAR|nr:hypothetical protein EST38_g10588 [Candolleomyces aberdarensis]